MSIVSGQRSAVRRKAPGFTAVELILVVAVFGVLLASVSAALSTLQPNNAVRDAALTIKDTLRRAETQAMTGYFGDKWGVHLSNSDGCALPATQINIFRGDFFTSGTTTIDVVALPGGTKITALAVGSGCDVKFARFEGSTTSTGTITVTAVNGATSTVSINQYGRVTVP